MYEVGNMENSLDIFNISFLTMKIKTLLLKTQDMK